MDPCRHADFHIPRLSRNLLGLAFFAMASTPGIPLCAAEETQPAAPDKQPQATSSEEELKKMSLEELTQVNVSPFEVSTKQDSGYVAANSVTGSRLDTPIKDLPFAIQAFNEDFIDDQRPENIFDVARYSPGVTYRSNDFNEGNANTAIRGFAVSATPGNVQILRDGFHGPSIFDFTNIDRVEVVKGPSSFLYGQVAPGGIINVITKDPLPEFAAMTRATYGSYDSYRFDADVTGPLGHGLFYRIAGSYDQDIGYWDPYDAHSSDIAPSLLWQPNDRVSLSLKYENFSKREDPQVMQKPGWPASGLDVPDASDPNLSGVDVAGLPDKFNSMSYADFRDSDTEQFTASLSVKATDHWNLRARYSHLEYEIDELFTGNLGMVNSLTYLQGRRVRRVVYGNQDDTFEAEGVGQYEFGGVSMRLLMGGQYIMRNFDEDAGQAPNVFPASGTGANAQPASPLPVWDLRDPSTWDPFATVPLSSLTAARVNRTTDFTDWAVYAGTTFGFFDDRLLVLTGWRLTETQSQLTDHLTGAVQPEFSESVITPQYGVLYKVTPGLSLFGSYAESFVPGSQILNNIDGTQTPASPTEGNGYDIGIKADLCDGRVSGTLTYFEVVNNNIVNDISFLNPDTGVQQFYNVQSGEQRSRGVEFDTTISLTDNWQAYLSYSYMDARIVEFSGNDAAILAAGPGTPGYREVRRFHDAPLQMSAPHMANLWTRYDFTQGALEGFHVAGGVNFVYDQTLLPDTPEDHHQTYTLLNAMVGYTWQTGNGQWMSLDLMGKNLAGEEYRPSQSSRARPREFALSFTAKF